MQREDGAVSSCALGFIPAGTGNTFIGEALGVKTAGARDAAVRAAVQAWPGDVGRYGELLGDIGHACRRAGVGRSTSCPSPNCSCTRGPLLRAGHAHVSLARVQAILDGRSRRVDCQQLDMTGLDHKPLRRVSVNTVMAGFGPDANAVAERRRWMGPMRYSISVAPAAHTQP